MTAPSSILELPYAFGNVHQPGTTAARHKTINMILDRARGGLASFNEAGKDAAYIAAAAHARGMSAWTVGENGLAWDQDLIVIARFRWLIMVGGPHAGPGGSRVGPNRYLMIVVLWDPKTRLAFFHSTKHDIAKADTSHKERRPLRTSGWKRAGYYVAQILDDVPSGILSGDTNTAGRQDLPGVPDVTIATPATFGHNHYDKLSRFGSATVLHPVAENTPSDHHMLHGTFRVIGIPGNKPTVDMNSTGSVATQIHGATNSGQPPVDPRTRYSRRWRRRHPIRWRRILRRYRRALAVYRAKHR